MRQELHSLRLKWSAIIYDCMQSIWIALLSVASGPLNYPNHRDLQILKTSPLKSATYLVKDIPVGMKKKVELALDVAKRLEKYLTIVPVEEEESLLAGSGEQGRFEGEF
jgi:acetylglutamate kinase